MNNKIGEYICSLRKKNKISQIDLAKELNISNATLCNIENGKHVATLKTMNKIINHFNMTYDEFYAKAFNTSSDLETKVIELLSKINLQHGN